LGSVHRDASLPQRQYFLAFEVAAISNGVQVIGVQRGFRSLPHMCSCERSVPTFVTSCATINVLCIDQRFARLGDHAAATSTRRHRTAIRDRQ